MGTLGLTRTIEHTRLLATAGVIGLALIATLRPGVAAAQTDTTFTYQGSLTDAGSPANGTYAIDVSLWNAASGGIQVGSTLSFPNVAAADGLFSLGLDYGADAFRIGTQRWLQITVNGTTLTPRQPITRAPYSIQTRGMVSSDSGPVAFGAQPSQNIQINVSTALPTAIRSSTGADNGQGVAGFAIGGTGDTRGVSGTSNSTEGTGVYGEASATTGFTNGVRGVSTSSEGRGVFGEATATSGFSYGVFGQSESPNGVGVYGLVPATSGFSYGVWGQTNSTGGRGVYGLAPATSGVNFGVYGRSQSIDGTGVYGEVGSSTSLGAGVRGVSFSPNGRGVEGENFNANGVGVMGKASAGSGTATAVYGESQSTSGRGVFGEATATSGVNFGVQGQSNSIQGFDFFAAGVGTNYGSASSIRWKTDVEPIAEPLDTLRRIRGVTYTWDEAHGGHHDIGFIAEEVGAVLPEIVAYEENGIDAVGLDYSKMTPLLVEALKELSVQHEAARASHEAEVTALRDRIARLESLLEQEAAR